MGGHWDEIEEKWTHVFVEFGNGAFPSATGVNVDHGLVEVDSEKVYSYYGEYHIDSSHHKIFMLYVM